MRRPLLRLVPLALLAGCELTETTVPPGDPIVVMQSIISRTRGDQWVLLEYSVTGNVQRGPTGSLAPPQSPRLPISGAFVTASNLGPGPCAGRIDTLIEAPVVTPGAVASGVYRWPVQCAYDPGDVIRVRAETRSGEVVTGTTTLPGVGRYDIRVGNTVANLPLDELLMDRSRDTLKIGIDPAPARAMQTEVRRAENQDDIAIYAFTDSLGIAYAGDLVNPFEGDSGETVFRAGRYYLLTVAATDSNYYDFIRSRSDPLTGNGYLNHLEGGVGVVGSVEAQSWVLAVVAPQTDPREGRYRITGTARGQPVDITLDVYLDELDDHGFGAGFSAFVEGSFFLGSVRRSGDGRFGLGGLYGLNFEFTVPVADGIRSISLVGNPSLDGSPFPVEFGDVDGTSTLTMQRLP